MRERQRTFAQVLGRSRTWAYALFWSWNVIFLAFLLLGFAPVMLPDTIRAVRSGDIPAAYVAYAVILTAIPLTAMLVGATALRDSPERLLAFGYGIEGPLMIMLLVRFFLIRQAMPPVTLLSAIAGAGLLTLSWQILDRRIDERGPFVARARLVGLALLLMIGLYAAVWIAFYAPPITVQGPSLLVETLRHPPELRWMPLWVLAVVLGLYTATLFVALPIVVPVLYVRAWWEGIRSVASHRGRWRWIALTVAVILVCSGLLAWTNQQPQHRAFALLNTPPQTPEEAQALLDQRRIIRKGLLNAYLAPYRYISAVGEVRHINIMYQDSLGLSYEQALFVQRLYEIVTRPLLYKPVSPSEPSRRWDLDNAFREEPPRAAELYEAFFDQSIVDGERDVILRTVRSTYSVNQARAAVLAVDDREVLLARQEVTIREHGDWAEVELYEVYRNQTGDRQEVVVTFSLPESAVITGLWLGNSPERSERFDYRVAPRGAAQATYRNELRRRVDPALVEQIGPRQYRLRVFPVEPQRRRWDSETKQIVVEDPPALHMWMTYQVLVDEGAWPLPRMSDKRNLYWEETSDRLINGHPIGDDEESWLPPSVPATGLAEPAAHRVDFASDQSVVAYPATADKLPALPADLQLAVVLDRSYSMGRRKEEVQAALSYLTAGTAPDGIDVYLAASEYHGEDATLVTLAMVDLSDVRCVGAQNAAQLLAQFGKLRGNRPYDAVFVLTDGASYESGDPADVPAIDAPLWMVHVGGELPPGYDDAVLEAIQSSGGGTAGGVREAVTRLAASLEERPYDVIDGYIWWTMPTEQAQAVPAAEGQADGAPTLAPVAARRLILSEMERHRNALAQLETLDALHDIAVEHGIVTPYSSMIVLVEASQEELLRQLEARGDRFQREFEAIGETEGQTALLLTGVPEPEEWLLMALAAAMLLVYAYKKGLLRGRGWAT